MAPNHAGEAKISSLLMGLTLSLLSAPLWADEYAAEIVRANEPAMADRVPMQSLDAIRDIMIAESIQKHGFCACPYNTDALGGQCGTLSIYYNEPWKKSLCYRRDISSDMIYFFKYQRALNFYVAQEQEEEEEDLDITSDSKKRPKKSEVKEKVKEKADPTADYFRNSAKPIPKTTYSSTPSTSSSVFDNTSTEDNPDYTSSGYLKNTSIPVAPVSNTTNLVVPALPSGK